MINSRLFGGKLLDLWGITGISFFGAEKNHIDETEYLDHPEASKKGEELCTKYGITYLFNPSTQAPTPSTRQPWRWPRSSRQTSKIRDGRNRSLGTRETARTWCIPWICCREKKLRRS